MKLKPRRPPDQIMTDQCPECRTDLTGTEIPERAKELYAPGATHFTLVVARRTRAFNSLTKRYEELTVWRCPVCGHQEKDLAGFAVQIPTGRARGGGGAG